MSTTPSPLKRSADEAFEGPLYLQHWFNTLEKADEHGKTHECKECQARVKWQGKKTGYKQFIQHVQQHTDWKDKMKQVIDAKVGKEGRLHGLGFTITKKISPEARFLVFLRASKSLWDVHTIKELTKRNFEKTGKGHDDESDIDEQV